MRIIRGIYGRRRFQVPSTFDARPTTDFAKENLFNVLENLVTWDGTLALDLFSGTGSIAFELLSRGCSRVTAVEADRTHAAFIADVARRLAPAPGTFTLVRGDAFRYLRTAPPFDLIFAEPPYALPLHSRTSRLVRLLHPPPLRRNAHLRSCPFFPLSRSRRGILD